ncbi:WD40 repeat domain-containing protein [Thermosulfurimonas dismutans]|nr:WD40 repeat domain-containing protein [Thermosulfurimonas dismutans]
MILALFLLPRMSFAERFRAFGLNLLWEHPLGDISFHVRAGHTPDSFVRFSPDGRLLAVGTLKGDLLVFESLTGKLVLRKKIPEAMVKRVAFSPDAKRLYYGEQSPEGAVCALELPSGKTLWCFRTAGDLLRGEPPLPGDLYGIYRLPGIYRLKILRDGDLLVLGIHSWYDRKLRIWRRLSRLYRLSPKGKIRWAYPSDGPAPVNIIYADSDPSGKRVALVALLPSEYKEDLSLKGPPPQSFVALDGRTGRKLFHFTLSPLKPYFDRVSAWESVAVSRDGRFAILGTTDGRLFVFDLEKKSLHRLLTLATPIILGGFPVSASLGYGLFGPDGLIYVVSGESTLPYGLPLAVDRPAGPHPAARTLFAVDPKTGAILWRFTSPVKLQGLSSDATGRTLAVCTGAFRKEALRVRQFGVLVFDLKKEGGGLSKLVGYFPTAGTCFFHLAVSPDGHLIAAVETPWRDEIGRLYGKHRLLVLRRSP